jgi:hypothetical protein
MEACGDNSTEYEKKKKALSHCHPKVELEHCSTQATCQRLAVKVENSRPAHVFSWFYIGC